MPDTPMPRLTDKTALSDYFDMSEQLYYVLLDQQGVCRHANPFFQKMFPGQSILDKHFRSIFTDETKVQEVTMRCQRNGDKRVPVELDIQLPGDKRKNIRWEFSLCETANGELFQGIGIADSGLAFTPEQLQKSEHFYRNLITGSLDGVLLTDTNGMISFTSPSVTRILGYEPLDLNGTNIFNYVFEEDLELAVSSFRNEVKTEPVVKFINIRLLNKNGDQIWCMVRGHNLLNDPVLQTMVIYFTDDTKRKLIEDRLRESESRFRNMIHNLTLGIVLLNDRSEVLVCNKSSLEMLGISEEELLGLKARDARWNVIHENGTPFREKDQPVSVAIRTMQPVRDVIMGVYRPATNDRVWLLVNAEPVFDANGKLFHVICSYADITEQRKLSQQLVEQEIQKQRLITQATIDGQEKERTEIGKELHDNINQHLTTTRLYLEVASELANGRVLELIRLAHKNLSDTVHEIRSLSQSLVPPTLGDLGLAESIQDLCDSLRRTHSFKVIFQHRYFSEDELPGNLKLMIFRIIQEQVSNIIRHAEAKTIIIKLQADAESVSFSIADDGKGFDPQDYKKGMGFSNMSNRASLFDGKAAIDAAPGKGCTVTVTIPLIRYRELI
jgi:PAS domain S-box-containing protein